jgi:hypothetical protein
MKQSHYYEISFLAMYSTLCQYLNNQIDQLYIHYICMDEESIQFIESNSFFKQTFFSFICIFPPPAQSIEIRVLIEKGPIY